MASLRQRTFCEWLGTAFLLAAVVGSGIMAQKLASGNVALALLCNTLPTGAILVVLILVFGPLSGAHFNPAAPIDLGRMFANETTLRFSIGAPTDDREQAANLILTGDIDPRRIISHRLTLEHAAEAYGIFRSHGATKVILTP